jgi:hypothetical protein
MPLRTIDEIELVPLCREIDIHNAFRAELKKLGGGIGGVLIEEVKSSGGDHT